METLKNKLVALLIVAIFILPAWVVIIVVCIIRIVTCGYHPFLH